MPIDLAKRTSAALVSLQKVVDDSPHDLGELVAQLSLAADRSGSAAGQWPDVYQEAIERTLGLSLTGLDDDGKAPFFIFDSVIRHEVVLDEGSYRGYVPKIHKKLGRMGGTQYAPVIERMLALGDPATEADQPPHLHIFGTDGEPSDRRATEQLLIQARTRPHFFQMVLIGGDADGEAYLQRLNNELRGEGVDNVGVTIYRGFPPSDDTAFYDDVVREFFTDWLPAARKAGITHR